MPQWATNSWSVRALLIGYGGRWRTARHASGGLLVHSADLERAQLEHRMLQVASALADAVDRELDRRLAMLQTLATSRALNSGDLAAFHAQASSALAGRDEGVFLIEPRTLKQLLNTRRPYGTELPTYGAEETAARVVATREPQISDVFIGQVIKRPVFDIAFPILEGEQLRYILSLGLDPSEFVTILNQNLGAAWIGSVWDKNDAILARSRDHDRWVGQSVPPELRRTRVGPSRVITTVSMEGERVLLATAVSRLAGWRISVSTPLAMARAPLMQSVWVWGATAIFALIAAAGLAVFFGRLLERPLTAAADAARAFGDGQQISAQPYRRARNRCGNGSFSRSW
jgi:hypothetical protein